MNLANKTDKYVQGVRDRLELTTDGRTPVDLGVTCDPEYQAGWRCADEKLTPLETALGRVCDAIAARLDALQPDPVEA